MSLNIGLSSFMDSKVHTINGPCTIIFTNIRACNKIKEFSHGPVEKLCATLKHVFQPDYNLSSSVWQLVSMDKLIQRSRPVCSVNL